ncbi:uncharacterized protein LOC144018326 [Festucalex cinctus]
MDTRVLVLLLCVQQMLLLASQSTHAMSIVGSQPRSELERTSRWLEKQNRHSNCNGRAGACGRMGFPESARERTSRRLKKQNRHSNCSRRPRGCGYPGYMAPLGRRVALPSPPPPPPPPPTHPTVIACFGRR